MNVTDPEPCDRCGGVADLLYITPVYTRLTDEPMPIKDFLSKSVQLCYLCAREFADVCTDFLRDDPRVRPHSG